jgi:hypothetical protein
MGTLLIQKSSRKKELLMPKVQSKAINFKNILLGVRF